jgi:hypothetical protein
MINQPWIPDLCIVTKQLKREHSMLSFEGSNFQGVDKIMEKIEVSGPSAGILL